MGTPLGRYTLTQLAQGIRDKAGIINAALSPDLPDAQTSTQKWAIYTMCNQYVQSLRARVLQRLQQEGVNLGSGLKLYFDFWRTNDADTTVSGSTVWLPADCDKPIRLIDTTTRREIPIVSDPGPYRYRSGVCQVAVNGGHQINSTDSATALNRKLTIYPSDVAPTLTVDMYRLPAAMDETTPNATWPDLPAQYQDAIIYGVAADIVETTGPDSTYQLLSQSENRIFQSMIREGVWL